MFALGAPQAYFSGSIGFLSRVVEEKGASLYP